MLLFSKNIRDGLRFAAWHISEGEAFFRDDLPLSVEEAAEIQRHQDPLRSKEWLASRWLLHQLTGHPQRLPIAKDAYSKPFFTGDTNQYCSLSHSRGIVAALLSEHDCGCDIQVLVDKMPRIAPKFMRSDEFEWVHQRPVNEQFLLIHLFWTAKEAMFKAYGQKEVDFKGHLFIDPFGWTTEDTVVTTGYLKKDQISLEYRLYMGICADVDPQIAPFMWTVAVLTD
jgi:4'-phosphopantetheinyl transferase